MDREKEILSVVSAQSRAMDTIASRLVAGEYTDEDIQSKLESVARVLETTASAQDYLYSQIQDASSFSVMANDEFDSVLSKVLATQAQAELLTQALEGELVTIAGDEESDEDELDAEACGVQDDEILEAKSFDMYAGDEEGNDEPSDEDDDVLETDAVAVRHNPETGDIEAYSAKPSKPKMMYIKKQNATPLRKPAGRLKVKPTSRGKKPFGKPTASAEELMAQAQELIAMAQEIGQGDNHGEINPQVKQREPKSLNKMVNDSANGVPAVKTVASETTMQSTANDSSSMIRWDFV